MKDIKIFIFDNNDVRTVEQDGEHLFVAKDICKILEVKNSRDALKHLDDDEKYGVVLNDSMGREQNAAAVNESGMYALVMRSRKPQAKLFRKWVTSEVLPTIRQTGGAYLTPQKAEELLADPDLIIGLAKQVKDIKAERDYAIATKAQISDKKTASALGTASGAVKRMKIAEKNLDLVKRQSEIMSLQIKKMSAIRKLMRNEQGKYIPYKRSSFDVCVKCGKLIKNVYGLAMRPEFAKPYGWTNHVHVECYDQHIEDTAVERYQKGERVDG